MDVRTFAWRGPVPDGCTLKPRTVYPLCIVNGEPLACAVTGHLFREQIPVKDFVPVPLPREQTVYPLLSDESIAEMIVRSYQADGLIPRSDDQGNGPSGNGGAKVPRPSGPRPITPISGHAKQLPKVLRP